MSTYDWLIKKLNFRVTRQKNRFSKLFDWFSIWNSLIDNQERHVFLLQADQIYPHLSPQEIYNPHRIDKNRVAELSDISGLPKKDVSNWVGKLKHLYDHARNKAASPLRSDRGLSFTDHESEQATN